MSDLKTGIQNHKTDLKYRSYHFAIDVIKFLDTLPNKRVYWVISDQLMRAATSIGANIIEAKAASSRKDFIKYYEIALKSANEGQYWLNLLKDATDLGDRHIEEMLKELDEISKMLGASILTLKNKRF